MSNWLNRGGDSRDYSQNRVPVPSPGQGRYNSPQPSAGNYNQAQAEGFEVTKQPEPRNIYRNIACVCQSQFPRQQHVVVNGYVLTVEPHPEIKQNQLALSQPQRTFLRLGQTERGVPVQRYDHSRAGGAFMYAINIEIGFLQASKSTDRPLDQDELGDIILQTYTYGSQILAPGVNLVLDYQATPLKLVVKAVQLAYPGEKAGVEQEASVDPRARGLLTPDSIVNLFKDPASPIKLKGSSKRPATNTIIKPDFKFESLGIGGLDEEFSQIFRRAFASRIFPPGLVEKMGIQHVKGILLYGPPGTGKTLIARQIGKMLNSREPKVVNGPEILNKFVGASEENIRKLFADAEKEYKEKAEESELHIIIFDELDAICKQRGGKNDGTGVGDSVVNQLLSKMDGVDQLNNVLIIGMTNRMDMIDEALLRPGRLEVHIEISLPDEKGRQQILKIHTNHMRVNDVLEKDVDLQELAAVTKNFSGAEIGGLVKSATSFAFNRHIKIGAGVDTQNLENLKVSRQDFLNALDEVKPAFGVAEEEFEQCRQGGMYKFSDHINMILEEGKLYVSQVRESERTPLVSVLLHGAPGAGKTALAAEIATGSDFPFIKLISPEAMVGYNEMNKVAYLTKVFMDAYKSPLNIVVIDNIERILDWVPIGPRFSNSVLQTMLVLLRKPPPRGRKLLIIATTTERSILAQMDLLNAFDQQIPVPNVHNHNELGHILEEVQNDGGKRIFDTRKVLDMLQQDMGNTKLNLGIKKILMAVETARQDEDPEERFVKTVVRDSL